MKSEQFPGRWRGFIARLCARNWRRRSELSEEKQDMKEVKEVRQKSAETLGRVRAEEEELIWLNLDLLLPVWITGQEVCRWEDWGQRSLLPFVRCWVP